MNSQSLARFFALGESPKFDTQINLINSVDAQDQLLNQTILSPIANRHSLPNNWIQRLLQSIVRTCENAKLEVSEKVYEQLANTYSSNPDRKCYGAFFSDTNPIVFQLNGDSSGTSFVQNGSTGFFTWEAGKCLAWYISASRPYAGESLLELGAGTGVTGIIIAKNIPTLSRYFFSDYHADTLKQARNNCTANGLNTNDQLSFLELDMIRPLDHVICADLILGADILYDTDLCEGLVNLMESGQCQFKEALLMSTIRTESTYNVFKQKLNNSSKVSHNTVFRCKYSEWISMAYNSSVSWGDFVASAPISFDPEIELVSIKKQSR